MSDDGWYLSRNDERVGPLTFENLEEMAGAQSLRSDELLWQVGTPSWVPAAQIPGLCAAGGWGIPQAPSLPRPSLEARALPHLNQLRHRVGELDGIASSVATLPHLRLVQRTIEGLGRRVTVHQLDLADRMMKRAGSLGYMIAAVLYAAFFTVVSLRSDSIQQLLATVLIVIPGASLCHFIAIHSLEANESTLRQTPSQLSSNTLTMSLGLLSGAAGVFMLVLASNDLFRKVDVVESIIAIPIALTLLYAAVVCLSPVSMNLTLEAVAHGPREALGLLTVLFKLPLRLASVLFGLSSLLAAGSAIYFCYQLFQGVEHELLYGPALTFARDALLVGLLPMALYLVAVLGLLLVDLLRGWLDTAKEIRSLASALK